MLENYANLKDALDPGLEVFDALALLSFDLDRQPVQVQQEYWQFMRDLNSIFGLDMFVAERECEL